MQWPRGPMNHLHFAACTSDMKAVKALLSSTAVNIDLGDPKGHTPLHFAAILGSERVVKLLLDKGANMAVPNFEGFMVLISCAQQGHVVVCKMLVAAGADVEVANLQGSTALYTAATRGHRGIAEALIDAGVSVDRRRVAGTTPRFTAADIGHFDIAKLLLRAKADALLTRTDPSDDTWLPLDTAVATGHLEVACELIRQRGIDGCAGPSRGVSALCLPVRLQQVQVLAN
eukprot:g8473.t1